jgi:hypothetical protein
MDNIKIVTTNYTYSQWVTKIKIKIIEMVFNTSATFEVESCDGNSVIRRDNVKIEGDEYSNWDNDTYLVNLICNKLGYVPI